MQLVQNQWSFGSICGPISPGFILGSHVLNAFSHKVDGQDPDSNKVGFSVRSIAAWWMAYNNLLPKIVALQKRPLSRSSPSFLFHRLSRLSLKQWNYQPMTWLSLWHSYTATHRWRYLQTVSTQPLLVETNLSRLYKWNRYNEHNIVTHQIQRWRHLRTVSAQLLLGWVPL